MSKAAMTESVTTTPPQHRLNARQSAILWVADLEWLSAVEQRVLLTLARCVDKPSSDGPGWIAYPSLNQLVEKSGVARGSVVYAIKKFLSLGLLTRVGGNIRGDTTVYTLTGRKAATPPRSTGDLGQPVTQVNTRPRSAGDLKSIESPYTRDISQSRDSLDSSPPRDSKLRVSRSLLQASGPLPKVTPEVLKNTWAPIEQRIRNQLDPEVFHAMYEPLRLAGFDAHWVTVVCPYAADSSLVERMAAVVRREAEAVGMLRGRDVRILLDAERKKLRSPQGRGLG